MRDIIHVCFRNVPFFINMFVFGMFRSLLTYANFLLQVVCTTCCFSMCLVFLIDFVDGIKESKVTVFKSNKTERTNLPNKWIHRKSDNVLFPVLENIDLSTSRHVAFTDKKPILPPSADIKKSFTVNLNDLDSVTKRKQNKTSKNKKLKKRKNKKKRKQRRHRHRHSKSRFRSKRSHVAGEASSVCTSISKWVTPSGEETLDQWGQTVTILPYIMVGSRQIQQFIYETSCLEDNIPCKGIDKRHYKSECITKKVYAYAYVRSSTGEENWSYIEIDGYCNCKLQRKRHSGPRNILDYLSLDSK